MGASDKDASNEQELFDFGKNDNEFGDNKNAIIIKRGNRFLAKYEGWEFLFYNVKPDKTRLEEYCKFINELLNKNGDSLNNILYEKTLLKKISQNKKKLMPMGGSNHNSVVMYHAPLQNSQSLLKTSSYHMHSDCTCCLPDVCDFYYYNYCNCDCFCCKHNGTLLTGDLDCLNREMANIKEFIGEIRYDNINILLVPHHGATDRYYINYNFPNCIISYGLTNRHGHPTPATLKKIASCDTDLHLVNEQNGFNYVIASR